MPVDFDVGFEVDHRPSGIAAPVLLIEGDRRR
jgi:hypothetical protein